MTDWKLEVVNTTLVIKVLTINIKNRVVLFYIKKVEV